jgi:predicted aspartyl protease
VAGRDADTTLKLRMTDGRPTVNGVFVNGHGPYRFLVDTGTSVNHLAPKLARAAGFAAEFRTNVTSATATIVLSGVSNASISLGPARADQQTVLIGGLDEIQLVDDDIQGILGQSFLSRFDYLIDVKAKRLVFGPIDAGAAGTRTPLRLVDGRPAVDTNLGRLLIDSGAHRLVLFNVAAPSSDYRLVTLGGSADAGLVLRELRIANREFWRGEAIGLRSDRSDLAGLMPVDLFRSVYVSNSQGFVQLH